MADEPDQWYLMVEKVREGPLSKQDIQYLLSQKQIDGTTLAWHKGLSTWDRLRDIEDFRPVRSPEPPAEKPPPAGPTTPSEPVSQGFAFLGLWPKLVAVLVSLGLTTGGVYWTMLRVPSQPEPALVANTEVTDLLTRLEADDPAADQALADLGSQSVRPLVELLQDRSDLSNSSIKRILVAIGPSGISNLNSFLDPESTGIPVRIYIIQVLGEIGGLQVLPSLIQVLGDPSQVVQSEVLQALTNLGPQATPNLINQLQSSPRKTSALARKNLA